MSIVNHTHLYVVPILYFVEFGQFVIPLTSVFQTILTCIFFFWLQSQTYNKALKKWIFFVFVFISVLSTALYQEDSRRKRHAGVALEYNPSATT